MNKDGTGPRGKGPRTGRGLGNCEIGEIGKFRLFLLKSLDALRNPWCWWSFFKGLVIGFLLGWWLI